MAARKLFGTDGVRGVVGEDLSEELVSGLGRAFAEWSGSCPVLLGRDTRASGASLELALSDGLRAGGSEVRWGGILPTPAVALLAGDGCGAVVSASHNPPQYNGVKFLGRGGWKLRDDEEAAIEARVEPTAALDRPEPRWPDPDVSLRERYEDLVVERFGAPLGGLRVVCDSANGAMTGLAARAFERVGASVTSIADDPDGMNINVGCGATDLALLSETVARGDYDLGVAFDGDGDRMLAVDASGSPVDGDAILAVLALHLAVDAVTVTSMTNLGFHRLMEERGVRVVTTDVGDRYVLDALRHEGGRLGGEQSGHVILLDGHVGGDGLAAALVLSRAVSERGRSLAELASAYEPYPQAKANVAVRRKDLPDGLLREIESADRALGRRGRVLVRPSGTEPLVRVLVEAETAEAADDLCSTIAQSVARELG